jgi:endoglucanase
MATKPKVKAPLKAAARPTPPSAATAPAPPALSAETAFLKALAEAMAVSGDEGAVRKLILEAIRPHVDDVKVDALGNVLAVKKGAGRERVLVAAHMDEVGFMVSGHEPDGSLRFEIVGGIDERVLIGKPVSVGAGRVPGVIAAAPVHLLNSDRRNTVVKAGQLRLDLGADSAEAARRLVKVGDRGTFASELDLLGGFTLRGKALDDRLGCATLVELLRGGPYPCELHAAFTVQEEVGLRGARVAAFAIDPAAAFVLDCTPAHDLPPSLEGRENFEYNTRLGLGPAIYIADRATISDDRLVRYLARTAEAAGLPYQFRQPGGGGTDAGAIHRARAGVPSVSLSVPGRYLHGPLALARLDDWRHSVTLMRRALEGWSTKLMKNGK